MTLPQFEQLDPWNLHHTEHPEFGRELGAVGRMAADLIEAHGHLKQAQITAVEVIEATAILLGDTVGGGLASDVRTGPPTGVKIPAALLNPIRNAALAVLNEVMNDGKATYPVLCFSALAGSYVSTSQMAELKVHHYYEPDLKLSAWYARHPWIDDHDEDGSPKQLTKITAWRLDHDGWWYTLDPRFAPPDRIDDLTLTDLRSRDVHWFAVDELTSGPWHLGWRRFLAWARALADNNLVTAVPASGGEAAGQ